MPFARMIRAAKDIGCFGWKPQTRRAIASVVWG